MSEITDTIQEMKIEEAAECLVFELTILKSTNPQLTVVKEILIPKVSKRVHSGRRKEGYNYIPTVENRSVREPNAKYIENNWKDICLYCAEELEKYVVWDQDGVRLGTLEEYQLQQATLSNMTEGMASTYNKRADIINKRGGESVYINVNILQLPEGEESPPPPNE
jgi:hypothetical protein